LRIIKKIKRFIGGIRGMIIQTIHNIQEKIILLKDLQSNDSALKNKLFINVESEVRYVLNVKDDKILAILKETDDSYFVTTIQVVLDAFGRLGFFAAYCDKISKDNFNFIFLNQDNINIFIASYEKQLEMENEIDKYIAEKTIEVNKFIKERTIEINKIVKERNNPDQIILNDLNTDELLDLMILTKNLKDTVWYSQITEQLKNK
jgi:hypothetical protein